MFIHCSSKVDFVMFIKKVIFMLNNLLLFDQNYSNILKYYYNLKTAVCSRTKEQHLLKTNIL